MKQSTDTILKKIGLDLRKARIVNHLTQNDLGIKIGVSRQVIMRMESGEGKAPLHTWLKAAFVLGLLEKWQNILVIEEDPFEKFDREQQQQANLKKTRVRKVNA